MIQLVAYSTIKLSPCEHLFSFLHPHVQNANLSIHEELGVRNHHIKAHYYCYILLPFTFQVAFYTLGIRIETRRQAGRQADTQFDADRCVRWLLILDQIESMQHNSNNNPDRHALDHVHHSFDPLKHTHRPQYR